MPDWQLGCLYQGIVRPASKILISMAVICLLIGFNSSICCIQGWSSNAAKHTCCESGDGLARLAALHCAPAHVDFEGGAAIPYGGPEPTPELTSGTATYNAMIGIAAPSPHSSSLPTVLRI